MKKLQVCLLVALGALLLAALPSGAATGTCAPGTNNPDYCNVFTGGKGGETFNTGAGDDRVHGGGGNDTINAGTGDDKAYGDAGNDLVHGGSGNDRVDGGTGNDKVYGDAGNDTVKGGDGNDYVSGGAGTDNLSGGAGKDVINSRDSSRDVVSCGPGRDTVTADKRDKVAKDCEHVKRK